MDILGTPRNDVLSRTSDDDTINGIKRVLAKRVKK